MKYLEQSRYEFRISEQLEGQYVLIVINRLTNEVLMETDNLDLTEVYERLRILLGKSPEDILEDTHPNFTILKAG